MLKILILILLPLFLQVGCDQASSGPVKKSWGRMKGLKTLVGNMNDTTYSKTLSIKPRLNSLGQPTTYSQFAGKFIWLEFVATWCPTCAKQTPQTQTAINQIGNGIVSITVITSKEHSYEDVPTIDTAKAWVNQYNLNPKHVLVAENLWSKMIPEHRLLSSEGHTLFVHVGYLNSIQIQDVFNYYAAGWNRWKRTGEPAAWMTFLKPN